MNINMPRLILFNTVMLLLGLLVLFGFVGSVYLYISGLAEARPPAMAATITLEPEPPPEPLCPGDIIEYTFGAQPLRSPIVVNIVTTLWNVDKSETVIEQRKGTEEVRVWTDLDPRVNDENYFIPRYDDEGERIMPGRYQLRQAIVAESAAPSVFSLAFTIDKACR